MSRQLLYFADPMCSWCWGFHPVMEAVRAAFGAQLQPLLVMGGLRPWTSQPLREQDKAKIREHWEHVAAASGQPFDYGFFARAQFVYDTEPAARAVVAVARLIEEPAFDFLGQVQRAFYAENRDVTAAGVLADLAQEAGLPRAEFQAVFASDVCKQETVAHFETSQRVGVQGFPTLVATDAASQGQAIAVGYEPQDVILERLAAFVAALPPG